MAINMERYFLEHLPKGGARAARSQNLHMVCLEGSWRGERVSRLRRGACRRGWECQRRDRTCTHTPHLSSSERVGVTAATELRPTLLSRRRACYFPSLRRRRRRRKGGNARGWRHHTSCYGGGIHPGAMGRSLFWPLRMRPKPSVYWRIPPLGHGGSSTFLFSPGGNTSNDVYKQKWAIEELLVISDRNKWFASVLT